VNDRLIKLGATLGTVALTFGAPAIAAAQDQAAPDSVNAPDTSTPATYSAPTPAMADDQVAALQGKGFVNQSSLFVAQVDQDQNGKFGAISTEQLNGALDSVQVAMGDGTIMTLRQYLNEQAVDASNIVGLNVTDNAVIIAHS
jgi:hypothetical protein